VTAALIGQARQLARLREARLSGAVRALDTARAATRAADAAAEEARLAADAADGALHRARHGLAADPQEAERLLAVADKSRFAQAVARNLAEESAEMLAARAVEETTQRRMLIRARMRHARLADHLGTLIRRKAARDEEAEHES
jgi:chromosome segregation protein